MVKKKQSFCLVLIIFLFWILVQKFSSINYLKNEEYFYFNLNQTVKQK